MVALMARHRADFPLTDSRNRDLEVNGLFGALVAHPLLNTGFLFPFDSFPAAPANREGRYDCPDGSNCHAGGDIRPGEWRR